MFALIRTRFILLVTLMYTFQSYYVFRGKGRVGDGYYE
ncbi:cytochrome bd-type quinol oxidase subunit 2 [Pseudomonas sp. BE134]|jgi:cytochrome bd-type quinol oxidase subunit 2|nr:cytochrome bd-type quinol oxidase subunit 2 [Pseudomonas sp. BE134]